MNKTNVIFLDLDGVLVSLRSHLAFHGCRDTGGLMQDFDTMGVAFLKSFCDTFGFNLVISSTWRYNEERCKKALKTYCIEGLLHSDWRTGRDIDGKRGWEVKTWLESHPEVEKYLIIDDDRDFLHEQFGFLIHTKFSEGISSDNMKDMIIRATAKEWLPNTDMARELHK